MSAEILISEFESLYLNDSDFSEWIVYNHEGNNSDIQAVAYRKNRTLAKGQGLGVKNSTQSIYDIEIIVSKGAIKGLPEVTEKIDFVTMVLNRGDVATQKFRVASIIKSTLATWHLGLSK
jgi:hypothetical protein